MRKTSVVAAVVGALLVAGCSSPPAQPPPGPAAPGTDRAAFRAIYQELVETNTTASAGDCTLAARRMADRLKQAGYPDDQLNVYVPPDHPKEGGLIVTLPGADQARKPVLLLARIDVVEAKAEEWGRDPFKLVEDAEYFTARGADDDKAMAAIWVASLIRYRAEGFALKRTVKVALTCGEEGSHELNGVEWLIKNHRDWVDAAFAINEGADGALDERNNRVFLEIEAGEKVYQDFTLQVTDPGGHSSQPRPDNAIQILAAALGRINGYAFPVALNDVTRAYFDKRGDLTGGEQGAAMKALAANPGDSAQAAATLSADPLYNGTMRTTCVVTTINGGHAPNALPQLAKANVNCRILPGTPGPDVQQALVGVINDPRVGVAPVGPFTTAAPVPTLSEEVLAPVREVSGQMWPGVPLLPTMALGATDGSALNAAGIPTYGLSGTFFKAGDNHDHGLNEHIPVRSLYEARDFLHDVAKRFAG